MTPSFLRQGNLDQSELVKSIIGAVGDLDAYQLPDAKGFTSLVRHLLGVTDEWRQNFRDELLGTKEPDFKKFADAIDGVSDKGHVVVIGSADVINKANTEKPGWLVTQKVL